MNHIPNDDSLNSVYNSVLGDRRRRRGVAFDPSMNALQSVLEPNDETEVVIKIKAIEQIPPYDTWIPVRHDFFDRAEPPEPFVPYFGDSRKLRKKARTVFKQMENDNPNATFDISDGELDSSTNRFKPTRDDSFYDLRNRRRRQAERYTLLVLTRRHGTRPVVLDALAIAFSKPSPNVMSGIQRVARGRDRVIRDSSNRRDKILRQTQAIAYVILKGEDKQPDTDITINDSIQAATNRALRHFCFTCHAFACEIHDGRNVRPVVPIPDLVLNRRLSRLSRNQISPCGPNCYLQTQSSSVQESPLQPWTSEEIDLFLEARALHGEDPCSVAVVLNPRSCRQMHARMQRFPLSSKDTENRQKTKVRPNVAVATATIVDSSDGECDMPSAEDPVSPFQVKDEIRLNELTHTPFVPCNHKGACSEKNGCICIKNKVYCEPLCGCRTGRYVMGKTGMLWKGKKDSSGRPEVCGNRHNGCSCHGNKSKCVLESCPCVRDLRACDPDFCNSCEANFLPESVSLWNRRCGNTDLIAGRHKQVFVGPSSIHGFGLFSGQNFEKGDLLGPYCGRIMFSDALDRELRLPQAKKSTYAFNLTHDMTVDAGLIGCKAKFINHSDNNNTINCKSQMRRVRGDCRICIVATKPFRAGVELLMNYELDQGNGWLENGNSDADDCDDGESSDESDNDMGVSRHGIEVAGCSSGHGTSVL